MGGGHLIPFQNIGSIFKVADPQVVGMIAGPTFSDLLSQDTQFETGGMMVFQVKVEGRFGKGQAKQVFQKSVDGFVRSFGLLPFEFDGLLNHLQRNAPGAPVILSLLPGQGGETTVLVLSELSFKGGKGGFLHLAVRKDNLSLGITIQPRKKTPCFLSKVDPIPINFGSTLKSKLRSFGIVPQFHPTIKKPFSE